MCNMLSYVEFYRPKFFLLENVLGLLSHKLQMNKAGPQEGKTVIHGVVKYILRVLTSLGYVPPFSLSFPRAADLSKKMNAIATVTQVPGALQRPAGRGLRVAAESTPRHFLGRAAGLPASRVPDPDA